MKKSPYQVVSESVLINESDGIKEKLATWAITGYLAKHAWLLDNKLRTRKILKKYPTPEALYTKLISMKDPSLAIVAKELKNIDPDAYPGWVKIRFNPKVESGKRFWTYMLGPASLAFQTARLGVNAVRGADSMINTAVDKGRVYQTGGDLDR